jgi:hypothetical protein
MGGGGGGVLRQWGLNFFMSVGGYAGLAVARLVEALCYRPEGHSFDS